jgi:hypothetical protein
VKEVRSLTGISFPAAADLVKRFVDIGLLTEVTGQTRNRRFSYTPYIGIFAGDDQPEERKP